MPELFSYGPKNLRDFVKTNYVAILYTIIFHLVIAIILVVVKVDGLKEDKELGVMLDFTEEMSLEERLQQENIEVSPEWIEQVFEAREMASNKAVDMNDKLNQEISTEDYVKDLLDQLESEKDEEFIKNREKLKEIISSTVYEEEATQKTDLDEDKSYKGPTTITFEFLEEPKDRGKRKLTIPVYRCEGSANVVVELMVNQDGTVSDVEVKSIETIFESNCFEEAAQNAALTSKFRSNYGAPEKQKARITYQFMAQ